MAYVSAPQAVLRDHVAAVYNKSWDGEERRSGANTRTGSPFCPCAHLQRGRRLAGTASPGQPEQIYEAFQKLAETDQADPVQATGIAHNDTNFHLAPGRDAEHLYQVDEGAKLSILKRASSEKPLPGAAAKLRRRARRKDSPHRHSGYGRLVADTR